MFKDTSPKKDCKREKRFFLHFVKKKLSKLCIQFIMDNNVQLNAPLAAPKGKNVLSKLLVKIEDLRDLFW